MQRAYSKFSKETQNPFWIHKFSQETHPEKHRKQCLQYIGTVTVRYIIGGETKSGSQVYIQGYTI